MGIVTDVRHGGELEVITEPHAVPRHFGLAQGRHWSNSETTLGPEGFKKKNYDFAYCCLTMIRKKKWPLLSLMNSEAVRKSVQTLRDEFSRGMLFGNATFHSK